MITQQERNQFHNLIEGGETDWRYIQDGLLQAYEFAKELAERESNEVVISLLPGCLRLTENVRDLPSTRALLRVFKSLL